MEGSKAPIWQRASAFAAQRHAAQLRKDGRTPYFSHCTRVALTVAVVFGCDDDIALASALLHDTIEDTTADYDDIHDRFGPMVATCVACLTKNMLLPEREREADYDARLAHSPWQARLVKLADAYDNLHDAKHSSVPLAKSIERVDRAIAVARPLAAEHPALARAIEIVSSLAEPHR